MWRRVSQRGKFGLAIMAVVSGLAAHLIYRFSAYWEGHRAFEHPPTISVLVGFAVITALCGVVAVASVAFLLASATLIIPGRRVDLGLSLVVIVLLVVIYTSTAQRQHYFVVGMRDWGGEHANVQEIERWFHMVKMEKEPLTKTDAVFIDRNEWPPCVKSFDPSFVSLCYMDGVLQGNLVCGGGFLHWGLIVCDRREVIARQRSEYTMQVGLNSFIFVDGP